MKKYLLATIVVVGFAAMAALPAFAKPGQGGKGQPDGTQDQSASQAEVFGGEQGDQCPMAAAAENDGKGCGCGMMQGDDSDKGCPCAEGGDCPCRNGGDCKCGHHGGGNGNGGEGHQGCGMMQGDGQGHGCGCGMMRSEGHGKGDHKDHHKFWKCPKASAELNLTDDQKKKLEDLDAESEKAIDAIHTEMKGLKDQMKALLDAEPIDIAAIRALARQMADKKAEKMVIHMVQKAEAMNILDAAQRGKLKELHQKMKDARSPMEQDDADISCPKKMEEKAAALETEAKELDKESKALKARAKNLKDKAKKAKTAKAKSGKGKK